MLTGLHLGFQAWFLTKKMCYLLFEVHKVKALHKVTVRLRQPWVDRCDTKAPPRTRRAGQSTFSVVPFLRPQCAGLSSSANTEADR